MLIKEHFKVLEIDRIPKDPANPSIKVQNKIFSKVSRIYAKSTNVEIVLDINSELLSLKEGDMIEIMINESPFETKDSENNIFRLENTDEIEFAKNYEYIMHGVIFHSGIEENKVFIYASFGGLLMKYFGFIEQLPLEKIKLDKKILLMLNKSKR
jgi:hypothetical protein